MYAECVNGMYVRVYLSLYRLHSSLLRGQLPSPGGGRQYFYGHNGLHCVTLGTKRAPVGAQKGAPF